MIKPKPLGKDERDWVRKFYIAPPEGSREEFTDRLISALEYWRLVVKELPEVVDESDGCHQPECLLCNASGYVDIVHDADCPWKLAQEE